MTQTPNVTWRPFGPEDFDAAADLLGRTWLAEFEPEARRAASEAELAHYLARSTWGRVAERPGELLGVTLLAERGAEPLPGDWDGVEKRARAAAEADPRAAEALRVEMDGVEEEAALEADYEALGAPGAAAALKLLIVAPEAKGLGIGGRLFSAAVERLRETGAPGYHLLTDDACDVGFYEHKGLRQALRRRSGAFWPGVDPAADEFYVYVYDQEL